MRRKTALALALAPAALAVGAPAVEAASPLGTTRWSDGSTDDASGA